MERIAVASVYGPYVPSVRIAKILDEYMEWLGISREELIRELSAATGQSYDTWARKLYRIYSGESETVRFETADTILTHLYLADRWYTELADVYAEVA